MINLKIKTNGTVRNLTLPYPGQSIPDIIEKNSVVTVSEVTEPESLKYMEGHEWNIEEINFLAKRMESLPTHEVTIQSGRTFYRFTGSYDGSRSLPHKVLRLMGHSPIDEKDEER